MPGPIATTGSGRVAARSRMLAAVALAGAAALLAGCAVAGPGASQPPSDPPPAITGGEPLPLDEALLQSAGLFDAVADAGQVVRWLEPGESIAVIIGGSGAGGECIPQPHAAGLEPNAPSIVVRFDPPNPEVMCTMDFRLHGWELTLPQPIDADQPVPVRLANLQGDDGIVELELGPDDVLTAEPGGSADPQPSEIPGVSDAPDPEAIPDAQLPELTAVIDPAQEPAVAVRWIEPGVSLAVMLGGSGSEACVPQPVGAVSTGPGTIDVAFEAPSGDRDCSADLRLYGWRFMLAEAVSATLPVEVTVSGVGGTAQVTVGPDDVLDAP